uniref:Micronuclear isoform n=1 Tax=Tetrahymena thermophila TaxID=5911 RepID=A0A1P8LFV8_TETTH|nr:micronuclear isoform [Tetrahymena thermophila]
MLNKFVLDKQTDRNFSPFDKYIFEQLHLNSNKINPFHTDCKFTKRRVCYCNYHNSSLIEQRSQELNEAVNRYLKVDYSGATKQDLKRSLINRQLAQEKVKRLQDLEDLFYMAPKYEKYVEAQKEEENAILREQIIQEQKNMIINGQCYYCQTTHSNKFYEISPNPAETVVICEECAISNHPEVVTYNNKPAQKPENLIEKKKKRQEAQAKRLQTLQAKKLLKMGTLDQNSNKQNKQGNEKSTTKLDKEDDEDESDISETQKECNWEKCKKKNKSDPEDILVCKNCNKSFHAECCDPPLEKGIVSKYDWFCTECKLCIACNKNTKNCKSKNIISSRNTLIKKYLRKSQASKFKFPQKIFQENELLMCDCCDRPFHMSCLEPARTDIPEGRWFCKDCEKCPCCGVLLFQNYSRELLKQYSKQQVDNKIICKDCWVYYQQKKYCPICFKIIEENAEGQFVYCDKCELWLHYECEKKLSNRSFREINRSKQFCCSKCKVIEDSKQK